MFHYIFCKLDVINTTICVNISYLQAVDMFIDKQSVDPLHVEKSESCNIFAVPVGQ